MGTRPVPRTGRGDVISPEWHSRRWLRLLARPKMASDLRADRIDNASSDRFDASGSKVGAKYCAATGMAVGRMIT
ncbi:hypothetical protein MKUB_03690 [Mycobacterium kubicae]|uniref:Uncharacterized protein n=1 Tax=Mycobacterium kubicae TaxID=120959 RepID=A0ABQ1BGP9_9MYCO|nr:hypothetical protein MKUB_03690 [Mycobacterium kubicae]